MSTSACPHPERGRSRSAVLCAFLEAPSEAALPAVDPDAAEDAPNPAGDLRTLAAVTRRRAQTMRELQARAAEEGNLRDAASLAAAAALFERDAAERDRAAAAIEAPPEQGPPTAWLLAGVAAVLLAAGVRALGAGLPVLGCAALGGAVAAMIAGAALAVGRSDR